MKPAARHERKKGLRFIIGDARDRADILITPEMTGWQPAYNLFTTRDAIIVQVELPGVAPQDTAVLLSSRGMIITGDRLPGPDITDERCVFHNLEIPFGRFCRRIEFPIPVEATQCRYEITDGILKIECRTMRERIIPVEET